MVVLYGFCKIRCFLLYLFLQFPDSMEIGTKGAHYLPRTEVPPACRTAGPQKPAECLVTRGMLNHPTAKANHLTGSAGSFWVLETLENFPTKFTSQPIEAHQTVVGLESEPQQRAEQAAAAKDGLRIPAKRRCRESHPACCGNMRSACA